MLGARLVITALVVEKQTLAEVAARYGVHRSWVCRLKARYDDVGEAAFGPLLEVSAYVADRNPGDDRRADPAAA